MMTKIWDAMVDTFYLDDPIEKAITVGLVALYALLILCVMMPKIWDATVDTFYLIKEFWVGLLTGDPIEKAITVGLVALYALLILWMVL